MNKLMCLRASSIYSNCSITRMAIYFAAIELVAKLIRDKEGGGGTIVITNSIR